MLIATFVQCWRKSFPRTEQWTRSTALYQGCTDSPRYLTHNVLCLKSLRIFSERKNWKVRSTYNLCFQWVSWVGMPPAIQKPTLGIEGPGVWFHVDAGRLSTSSRNSTIMQYETNQLLFVRSPVGSIAVVCFSLSCSLTLLMPLPQLLGSTTLCKKKKKK